MKHIVQIIFVLKGRVLLGYRQNTEMLPNRWAFPAGRVEAGESRLQAAQREAKEEVAVEVGDLSFLAVLPDPVLPVSHTFFVCKAWQGKPHNAEPHLCAKLQWFELDGLPNNVAPITLSALPKLQLFLQS